MRGSIYRKKKPDGSWSPWYAVTDLPPYPDGRRHQKTSTHATRKEAERALAERIRALNTGTYFDTLLTVSEYLEGWLSSKRSIRDSTQRSYRQHIDSYLTPHLGKLRLADLRAEHLEEMYVALRATGTLGSTSIRRVHATIRGALNTAVRRRLIAHNPAVHVELDPAQRPRVDVWSPQQVRRFLTSNRTDPLLPLYHLLALRGLRRGEVVALRWKDIDLERGLLRVEQQLVEVGRELILGPPKTKTGARTVSLDPNTVSLLRAHKARQASARLALGGDWLDTGLTFTRQDGSAVRPSHVTHHFQLMVKKAGLPRIRLHDLRHTSASLGLEAGETLKEVSERLGHSSIVITADTYAHIAPELAQRSADRLADLVADNPALDSR